jgi:hypothetical protein
MVQPIVTATPRQAVAEVTLAWLRRAAEDPQHRHPARLPEQLDFSGWATTFLHTLHAAPAGTELGFTLLLGPTGLEAPTELAARARRTVQDTAYRGLPVLGGFHAHPDDRPPFFDPVDLATAVRSDNPGFLELLLARGRLYALVRANPFLYVSAHHVNRNPMLLAEPHAALVARHGARSPEDARWESAYRQAGLYYFARYQLALYEGDPARPLRRTVTPKDTW